MIINQSTIRGNKAFDPNLQNFARGGGIHSASFVGATTALSIITINQNIITKNEAEVGGGISNGSGQFTAINSTISDNIAENGGGLLNNSTATLVNTTFSGNQAFAGVGGGAVNFGSDDPSTVGEDPATLTLTNATIAFNFAFFGGSGIWNQRDSAPAQVIFKNTIVANNTGDNSGNLNGLTTTNGNNLENLNTCGFVQASDKENTDPRLSPSLYPAGGPTPTHTLLPGSPAIDAGDNAVCNAIPVNAVDQRGVAPPQNGTCDRGAVETIFGCPGVKIRTFPNVLTYRPTANRVARKRIKVLVINRSGIPTSIEGILAQDGEPFEISRVSPALPRAIRLRGIFDVHTQRMAGQTIVQATAPYFDFLVRCGAATTAPLVISLGNAAAVATLTLGPLRPNELKLKDGVLSLRVANAGRLELLDLGGHKLIDKTSDLGVWSLQDEFGRTLANGVYLYVLSLRDKDGKLVRHQIKRLAIKR